MSEMKKYMDVVRLGHRSTEGVLNPGDKIAIQEKIDGANASFKVENGVIRAFSRKSECGVNNTLRGFYQWTQTLNPDDLLEGITYFGEYLVKHKINYPEQAMHKFYLYDLYNEQNDKYLHFNNVKSEASRLGLNLIPLFYEGEYQSFEHLMEFVGKTQLGGEAGEGIVVKNVDFTNKYGNQLFVKLVSEDFREVQKQKAPKDPHKAETPEGEFVNMCLTKARVDKLLHKLVDEGILEERFGIEDMRIILRNLGSRIFEDILKEEKDSLPENYEENVIKKSIGKKLPLIVKEILKVA